MIVIQLTLLTAVQAQLDPVTIETLPNSPVEGAVTVVGETLYVHCADAGRAPSTKNNASMTPQHRAIIGSSLGVERALPKAAYPGPRLDAASC